MFQPHSGCLDVLLLGPYRHHAHCPRHHGFAGSSQACSGRVCDHRNVHHSLHQTGVVGHGNGQTCGRNSRRCHWMGGCHRDERPESVSVVFGFFLLFDPQQLLLDRGLQGLFLPEIFGVRDGEGRGRIRSRSNLFGFLNAGQSIRGGIVREKGR